MKTETTPTKPKDVKFETVVEWFEKAKNNAEKSGKRESAMLWNDGLAWLKYWHHLATDGTP